jgi:SAM-dependent methyltransferase
MKKQQGKSNPGLAEADVKYYKRDFWGVENLKYAKPHFRMLRVAEVAREIAGRRECDLLDVGCGPAALERLVPANVHYYGIDIAIQEPAPNLVEMDITESPIEFRGKKFDIILMQGVFEYLGACQERKFAELRDLLKPDGKLVVTYTNFAHRKRLIYGSYSNVQPPEQFRRELSKYFVIERCFPTSYNWNHTDPTRKLIISLESKFRINVPIIGVKLAMDHLYVCTARN